MSHLDYLVGHYPEDPKSTAAKIKRGKHKLSWIEPTEFVPGVTGNERFTMVVRRANKAHVCRFCTRWIRPGEQYLTDEEVIRWCCADCGLERWPKFVRWTQDVASASEEG